MNDLYVKITGKNASSGTSGSQTAMYAALAIICIISALLGSIVHLVFLLPGILVIIAVIILKINIRKCARASELAIDALTPDERQLLIDQGRKAVDSTSCEFGILTDFGIVDQRFFARWTDIESITVKPRKYEPLEVSCPMIPAQYVIKGKTISGGKEYRFSYSNTIRPERDMSDEIGGFIDYALKHNGKIQIQNDYRFWH